MDLYQHEVAKRLAVEYGKTVSAEDIGEEEMKYMIMSIEKASGKDHLPPAEWVRQFFIFLRETGKYPEMLQSPRQFAAGMICSL